MTVQGVNYHGVESAIYERKDLKPARILLADDNKEMRARIICLLEPEFEVVGAVGDGHALLKADSEMQPDVCVIDISMPAMCGIQAAAALKAGGSMAKVVILTLFEDRDYVEAALQSGALGYVVKSCVVSDLSAAIYDALAGRQFISPSLKLGHETEHAHVRPHTDNQC